MIRNRHRSLASFGLSGLATRRSQRVRALGKLVSSSRRHHHRAFCWIHLQRTSIARPRTDSKKSRPPADSVDSPTYASDSHQDEVQSAAPRRYGSIMLRDVLDEPSLGTKQVKQLHPLYDPCGVYRVSSRYSPAGSARRKFPCESVCSCPAFIHRWPESSKKLPQCTHRDPGQRRTIRSKNSPCQQRLRIKP